MLDLCLLGTGGMMPLPDRWLTSLLVRHNGRMILIDCGEGTQIPLKMAGWGFKTLDALLFTHYHADHIAGLPGLLLTLGNSGRAEPLTLMGPPGLTKVVAGLTVISPELPFELRIIELPEDDSCETGMGEVEIKSLPVDHTLACLAYCIELKRQGKFDVVRARELGVPIRDWSRLQRGETVTLEDRVFTPEMVLGEARKGLKVCYATDTRPCAGLIEFIKEADLFVCEGMYGEDAELNKAEQKRHMLFSEAAVLARQGGVKELWLTHYSPSLAEPHEYLESAQAVFANTIAGTDLLMKTIKYEES